MIDPVATAHMGCLRADPPGTGADLPFDAQLSAHMGFIDENPIFGVTVDDKNFCIKLSDDEPFCIMLVDSKDFCV